jgi:hypothetical protein
MGISILKFPFLGKSIRKYKEQFFYTFIYQKYQWSQDSNINRINGFEIKYKGRKISAEKSGVTEVQRMEEMDKKKEVKRKNVQRDRHRRMPLEVVQMKYISL